MGLVFEVPLLIERPSVRRPRAAQGTITQRSLQWPSRAHVVSCRFALLLSLPSKAPPTHANFVLPSSRALLMSGPTSRSPG